MPATSAREASTPAEYGPARFTVVHGGLQRASTIESARFYAPALHASGSFLVYLPPHYDARRRYGTLYLLHGSDAQASSFLQFGLRATLDRLIGQHRVGPMIAVMIQGGKGENDWLDRGSLHYESYVLEVRAVVDHYLPTIADRSGRAIAGYSMGGYGAVHIALSHLDLFSFAESWSGFFNGLGPLADADRTALGRLPLRAFLYGGAADTVVDSRRNAPFAARLRGDGARAAATLYPGGHTPGVWASHLGHMLTLVGQAFTAVPGR